MPALLVIGGARSGKSRFAERLARSLSEEPVYLATSRVWDDDYAARIRRHQDDRDSSFRTVEEEKHLATHIRAGQVTVVDCVTLWLTNWFSDSAGNVSLCLELAQAELERCLAVEQARSIFVTNELGQGVHPESAVARAFIDLQGFFNQELAARADVVVWMVAGLPQVIKGQGTRLGLACSRVVR